MRSTIRPNIHTAYSLHDMEITAFEIVDQDLRLESRTGLIRVGMPCCRVEGAVIFEQVQWEFSYACLMDHVGNAGKFSGEKMPLLELIRRYPQFTFTIADETYGFNMTRYTGTFAAGAEFRDLILEICHEGNMVFPDKRQYAGTKEIILSHDGEALLCRVPAEVADNLDRFCLEFADAWVWHGPENGRFLQPMDDCLVGAVFGAADFIDYLNRWAFPGEDAAILRGLGCFFDQIPAEYGDLPRYNF